MARFLRGHSGLCQHHTTASIDWIYALSTGYSFRRHHHSATVWDPNGYPMRKGPVSRLTCSGPVGNGRAGEWSALTIPYKVLWRTLIIILRHAYHPGRQINTASGLAGHC